MVYKLRKLDELINKDEPGWELVQEWIGEAINPVEVLPRDLEMAEKCLLSMQVTTRSPMGAIIYETGGLLVDDGWIRILGSGHERLPRRFDEWNWGRALRPDGSRPGAILIGDDAVGGFFALDGGAIADGTGNVFYFAPDSLEWEDMEGGYSDFIYWCFTHPLDGFYADYRWEGWRDDVKKLPGDMVYQFHPFPCAEGPPISERDRGNVPIAEVWGLFADNLLPKRNE